MNCREGDGVMGLWMMGYRVIHKKVSFGIFSIIKTAYDKKFFAIEILDKVFSLSRFSRYLVIVKIVKIRH